MTLKVKNKIPTHLLVAVSAWGSRVISAGVQLLSIRYLLRVFDTNSYSTFALLGALVAWSTLADMGIGNSLQNYISEHRAQGRSSAAWIATAAFMVVPLILFFAGLLYFISPWLSGVYLHSATNLTNEEKNLVFGLAAFVFVANSLGGIAYKVWFAKQMGWLANILPAVGALLGLCNILLFNISSFRFPLLAAVMLFFGPSAILALGSLYWAWHQNKQSFSLIECVPTSTRLIKRGWGFLGFAIVATLVLQADYLVMSQRLPATDIVIYSIMQKFFGLCSFVYSALLQALWPVCAELHAKQKWRELRTFASRYIWMGVLGMVLFSILFWLFHKQLMHLLSGHMEVPALTVFLFASYFVIRVWTDTYAMLLQSMNVFKPLWFLVSAQAVLSLGLQWVLAGLYGINGLLMGLILSFILTVSIGIPMVFYSELKHMTIAKPSY